MMRSFAVGMQCCPWEPFLRAGDARIRSPQKLDAQDFLLIGPSTTL